MPTYIVASTNIEITHDQKQKIAEAITNTHAKHTGAPAYFAQVLFNDLGAGDHFIGGTPFADPQVFVHGLIRAGRSKEVKRDIINNMIARISEILSLTREDIWAYIQDIEHAQMAEFGRILPAPGEEETWRANIGKKKIEQLRQAGVPS